LPAAIAAPGASPPSRAAGQPMNVDLVQPGVRRRPVAAVRLESAVVYAAKDRACLRVRTDQQAASAADVQGYGVS
jgi:hypothetical protein